MTPNRMHPSDDFDPLCKMMTLAFSDHENRIDPPSSAHLLTPDYLREAAHRAEIWVVKNADHIVASAIFTPKAKGLYVSKIAVALGFRRRGFARAQLKKAEERGRVEGFSWLELQSRVELAENHALFRSVGFVETARTAHPGFGRPTSITFQKHL